MDRHGSRPGPGPGSSPEPCARLEIHDAGSAGPVRYTILVPDAVPASASPACDLVEAIEVPHGQGPEPGAPTWGLVAQGVSLGVPIGFDQLPPAVQAGVRRLLSEALPGRTGDAPGGPDGAPQEPGSAAD